MTQSANIVTVTDGNFKEEIEGHQGLSMIDFWAEWCTPCRFVAPIVDELATEFADQIRVGKLDVDDNQETAIRFGVRSIPTLLFFKDGELVDTIVGAVPKAQLQERIERHL